MKKKKRQRRKIIAELTSIRISGYVKDIFEKLFIIIHKILSVEKLLNRKLIHGSCPIVDNSERIIKPEFKSNTGILQWSSVNSSLNK